jgi:CDP-6-deoxy-D-xylo-4-hexulose-3-dehydrase
MKYPLMVDNFTFLDRVKLATFILNKNNRLTQGKWVKKVEQRIAKIIGSNYAVMVSNGSTANTILAMLCRDSVLKTRNQVILPAITWTTSCSPWIREGFKPIFLDITHENLGMDLNLLEKYLSINHRRVAAVFPTTLLGFPLDILKLQKLKEKYKDIYFAVDNCESTFTEFNDCNISSFLTSTTSTYFGHELCSIEGGFLFTDNKEEYYKFLMYRNHGMVRSLEGLAFSAENEYANWNVDSRFDFYNLGNNFRNTEINAFLLNLDLDRYNDYRLKRLKLYQHFYNKIDKSKYYLPTNNKHIPFCLPIILKNPSLKKQIEQRFISKGVETRPIISGFLGNQTAYKEFFKNEPSEKFEVARKISDGGFYIGLHPKLTFKDIDFFIELLS